MDQKDISKIFQPSSSLVRSPKSPLETPTSKEQKFCNEAYFSNMDAHYEMMKLDIQQSLQASLQGVINNATDKIFHQFKMELEMHKKFVNDNFVRLEEETKSKIAQLEVKINKTPTNNKQVNTLSEEINFLHAKIRERNLVISGIMQQKEIDLHTVIKRIGVLYGTTITDNDITNITIMNKNIKNSQNSQNNNQPPNLLVEFSTTNKKNELFNRYITAIKNKKSHSCNAIGLNSTKKIYINEHFSKNIQDLKLKAKEAQKNGFFDVVTARPLYVSVKKGDIWTKIYNLEQLNNTLKGNHK